MYDLNPDIYHKRLQDIVDKMAKAEVNDANIIAVLVERIASKHPQVRLPQ